MIMTLSKKQVSFPENDEELCRIVCSLPNCADIDPDEASAMWYKKPDFQLSRTQSKQLSRQCAKDGHGRYLEGAFTEKSRETQEKLFKWAALEDDVRGLERWTNKCHGEIRQDDQFRVVMGVLEAQDSMVTYGEGTLDWDKLRKVYQEASRVSRHFARMMGKADSHAIAPSLNDTDKGANVGDSDSVTTSTTEVSTSPIKRIKVLSRVVNRKDLGDALSDSSTHSLSPLKRLRNRIQAKRITKMKERLSQSENLIEVV